MADRLPIAVTMGDPAGIGPEIVAGSFTEPRADARALVIGDPAILARAIGIVGANLRLNVIEDPAAASFTPGTIDLIAGSSLPADLPFGKIQAVAGQAAYDYIRKGIALALDGKIGAIATAPIHKEALKKAGVPYPGHTEMLADLTRAPHHAMMLFNDELRVLLVTIHLSLAEAIRSLTIEKEMIAMRLADRAARQLGVAAPRVAVAGLNPHAGENGLFGREDLDIIRPAIEKARAEGIDASGPWPGDTVFMQARQGKFDIVVAQYHDQGLIPVKYLGIEHGVNVTVGLPFVRTSVDHGTAFDIAGTGKASAVSMRVAIEQAAIMMRTAGEPAKSNGPDRALHS
ncbi:MAG: 4-hydroxythreonine-4-phosphate dehydrogenase PdxA [Rhodospirillaceae bacterium]|nr:4-hydroxythreonine-4-phosphate dehydrogenase PdxA [Rhodospirillaceae bacterium]